MIFFRDESLVGEYGSNYDKEKMEKMEEQEEDEIDHSVLQHVAPAPQHRQYLGNILSEYLRRCLREGFFRKSIRLRIPITETKAEPEIPGSEG